MESTTPFGKMTDAPGTPAPTKAEVAANPGLYDGTPFDPTIVVVPRKAIENYGTVAQGATYATFADWYAADAQGALDWFKDQHDGNPLVLHNLTAAQAIRMGATPTPPAGDALPKV